MSVTRPNLHLIFILSLILTFTFTFTCTFTCTSTFTFTSTFTYTSTFTCTSTFTLILTFTGSNESYEPTHVSARQQGINTRAHVPSLNYRTIEHATNHPHVFVTSTSLITLFLTPPPPSRWYTPSPWPLPNHRFHRFCIAAKQ